jgi:transcriptional regulator with XRE-family HTH domain
MRERAHLTQVELAGRLGVSQNRVSRLENGDVEHSQVGTLRRYAEAVGGRLRVEVDFGDSTLQVA